MATLTSDRLETRQLASSEESLRPSLNPGLDPGHVVDPDHVSVEQGESLLQHPQSSIHVRKCGEEGVGGVGERVEDLEHRQVGEGELKKKS